MFYDKPRMMDEPISSQPNMSASGSGQPEPVRVFLADSRLRTRAALRLLLEQYPEFKVVGEAAEVGSLLAQTLAVDPHLLLLDWDLRGFQADLLPALRKQQPDLKVVVMSTRPEIRSLALAAGVDAFVCKVDPPERLLACLAGVRQTIWLKDQQNLQHIKGENSDQ